MNENDRQVLERMQTARLELERKLLAELIGFEWKWGVQIEALQVLRVDVSTMAAERRASALVQVNLQCRV